jgi:hypothetical protein
MILERRCLVRHSGPIQLVIHWLAVYVFSWMVIPHTANEYIYGDTLGNVPGNQPVIVEKILESLW